jgi:hypothetical protein
MKRITFTQPKVATLQVRNNREQLIADIVDATAENDKKKLARLLAIRSRELQWSETDLHALFAKHKDPTIRNFTAFVKWSIKTKKV